LGNSRHLLVLYLLGVDFMKTRNFQKRGLTLVAAVVLAVMAGNVEAQDSTNLTPSNTANSDQPAAVNQFTPQMSHGVQEVLQLSQAKVADSVIISYVQTSGNNYGLNAAQIIYLRQQGVSDGVINTMINQRTQSAPSVSTVTTPAPETPSASSVQTSTATAQPAVAYVPATTASTVYVIPDTQTYNYNAWLYSRPYYAYSPAYYPYCYGWPAVSLSFGFGFGGYHNHGGYYGGWHGGHNGWHH
jgi:hypothetical protein